MQDERRKVMDRQSMIDGLQEAHRLLLNRVPVILAWDAIKAVKMAVEMLKENEIMNRMQDGKKVQWDD